MMMTTDECMGICARLGQLGINTARLSPLEEYWLESLERHARVGESPSPAGLPIEDAIDALAEAGYISRNLRTPTADVILRVANNVGGFTTVYSSLRDNMGYTGCRNIRHVYALLGLSNVTAFEQEGWIEPQLLDSAIEAVSEEVSLPLVPADKVWNATIGRVLGRHERNYMSQDIRHRILEHLFIETGDAYS